MSNGTTSSSSDREKKKKKPTIEVAAPGTEATTGEGAPTTAPTAPPTAETPTSVKAPEAPLVKAPLAPVAPPLPGTAAARPLIVPEVSGPTAPVNRAIPLYREGVFDANLNAIANQVQSTANAYRALPATASPEQKKAAISDYATMVAAQNAAKQQDVALQQAKREAGLSRYNNPQEIARYNQYLKEKGVNPLTIGSAELASTVPGVPGAGGMAVPVIEVEQAAKRAVKDAADDYRKMAKDARQMRRQLVGKVAPESRAKVRALEAAGLDVDNAYQVALANYRLSKDTSSLSALAEKEITKSSREQQERVERAQSVAQQKPSSKEEEASEEETELEETANLNAAKRRREWLEEQRRRQDMIMGRYETPA
jgi:hypothetical protein